MLLLGLAVPAMAAGFLKAFGLAFLLWPFNLALPLARDLPRACITLRAIVSFYAAGLRGYVAGARRGVQLLQARSQLGQHQDGGASASSSSSSSSSSSARGVARTRVDAVAHAMLAFDDIY
ncbi:hypothetical protein BDA96_06G264400 [Sorghum bicolor]|uniref:Uncharacterized protein n=2 Tax=Sorghum bicolor TaxID=4558 RepID=A0A921UDM3_SORBI|nr:uncharacterized protein LOC8079581 [Sorghum bicolor]KAG0527799.1 hypothetical protein BDA96_06G264400 [Sorghum bicolor]KXG27263.1 hypothetical protein SORBI_3006G241300 [Sorghum bicolor]|eukprot:XP_002448644.2 uncharacterized protein LOC8079581 [Sorghum bicolor]